MLDLTVWSMPANPVLVLTTPQFFSAIKRADQLAVELFVASGGIRMDETLEGKTAFGLAQELGKPEIIRLLVRKAASPAIG